MPKKISPEVMGSGGGLMLLLRVKPWSGGGEPSVPPLIYDRPRQA